MKVFAAWVNERKESYVGGREHTRGPAIEVEGDDDAEDKEQAKDKDKDKGKDKAKDEPEEKGKDKGQRKDKDKDKDKAQTTRASSSSQLVSQQSELSQQMGDVWAMGDEVVQWCKDSLTQQMSLTLRDCVASAMAKAMSDASKSKAETLIGRLTKQLEMERTGRVNAEAQLDIERKRVKDLELENESVKKQPFESNTKTAEAKQQAEQLLVVMAGNYKKA